jgi:hypothetical protein
MQKTDLWTSYAEAMELSLEGNRLIAREIADLLRGLWHRTVNGLDGMLRGVGQHRHLPPV